MSPLSLPKTQTRPEVYESGDDDSLDRRRRKVRRPVTAAWQSVTWRAVDCGARYSECYAQRLVEYFKYERYGRGHGRTQDLMFRGEGASEPVRRSSL